MAKKYKYQKMFTVDGKRYIVRADTEQELYEKYAIKKNDIEQGRVVYSGSMTVRTWTEQALKIYKTNCSESTLYNHRSQIEKHILSQIGSMALRSVKPIHCQQIMNNQAGMSEGHIKMIRVHLKWIFARAIDNQLISTNPAANLVLPDGEDGERRSITDFERKHFLKVAQDDKYLLFLCMLYCGCRPKEAANLEGRDIGDHLLHIRGTKTKNSDRYVPIPDELWGRIKDVKGFDPICVNEAGRRHSESSYKRLRASLYRAMNLSMGCRTYRNAIIPPYPLAADFVPYDLRHTYCTDLQKAGVDVRVAQKLMGHSSIEVTANIYTHVDMTDIKKAGDLLEKAQKPPRVLQGVLQLEA